MKSMQSQIESLTQRISDLEQRKSCEFEIVYGAIEEFFERDKKKNHMVAHSLPLPPNPDDKDADLICMKELATRAGGDPEAIVDVFRMGKERDDGKPRPAKVICTDNRTKRALIYGQSKFEVLRKNGFFLRDDMTLRQREADLKLREKLTEVREANPGIAKRLVIRDNLIVLKNANGKGVGPFQE